MALKTALIWSGAQSFIRLALGFLSIKVSAVYLGPAGLALVGQLGNFLTLVSGALGNGAQTGVVKLTAETSVKGNDPRLLWQGAMMLSAILGGLFGLAIAVFSRPLSAWLLESPDYWPVMALTGLLLPFLQFNLIITGAINGLKWIGRLGAIGIMSTITGAMVFIPACYLFGIWGGLVGSALSYAVPFLIALAAAIWSRDISLSDFKPSWKPEIMRDLLRFYPMLLTHAIAVPLATLLVRDMLSSKLGLNEAGFWQASWRLSDMYTQVLMLALSMFLMPHLSSIDDRYGFSREMKSIVTKVTTLTALAAAAIFVLRDWLIPLIFSAEFYPVRDLLTFQLLGDVFKMAGWPIRMVLVIKMRAKWYMFIEAAIAIMQVTLTYLMLPVFGVAGATMAYAASWLAALVVLIVVSREYWNVNSATSS